MKKKMQRFLSLILSICIISFVAIPVNVFSAEIETESVGYAYGDFYYNLDANSNAIITKYVGDDTDVVIPSTLKTYNVTEINNNVFKGNNSITSVTINENLKNINANTFYECTQLKSVKLPESLTTIGNYAFYGCDNLKEIEIPSNVTSIGTKAFGYDSKGNKCTGFQITGYHNTCAHTYANENNFKFNDNSDSLSYVEISNADDLFTFAEKVNSGNTGINAKLVADIAIPSDKNWTPIGTEKYKYDGVFDGQNYNLSGLNIDNSPFEYIGLFAYTDKNSIIKNVAINDITFKTNDNNLYSGAICGYNAGIVKNCFVINKVYGSCYDYYAYNTSDITNTSGVICGYNYGTITGCYNKAQYDSVAGICGTNNGWLSECYNSGEFIDTGYPFVAGISFINTGIINNCYNTCKIEFEDAGGFIYGICANNKNLVVNCAQLEDIYRISLDDFEEIADGNTVNCYDKYYYEPNGAYWDELISRVCAEIRTGEYTYLLSQGCTVDGVKYDGNVWGQDLSVADSQPTFSDKKVYLSYSSTACDAEVKYINNPDEIQNKAPHIEKTRIENEIPATCISKGSCDKVTYCTVCNAEFSRETEILEMLVHDDKKATKIENVTPASCMSRGYYDKVTYCTACNIELSRETIALERLDHGYQDIYVDGKCSVCNTLIESEHKYQNDTDKSWTIKCYGASSITLKFSELTSTEPDWDSICLYDANGKLFGRYTGTELANKSITVNGDTIKITLHSDDSNTYYGFKLTEVIPNYSTLIGDINGDNIINVIDATLIQKYGVGSVKLDEHQIKKADVNKNGVVNIIDATSIQKYAIGLIKEF